MLEFILGEAGSGKTELLCKRLAEAAEDTSADIIFLVPDQFVFESEKLISVRLGEHTEKVTITGFSALSEKILSRLCPRKSYADDTAKLIIMQRTIKEVESGLKFYGRSCSKITFGESMLALCEKFKSAGVTPEILSEADFSDELSSEKLSDIKLIYSSFNSYLTSIYDDRSDNLILAADAASKSDYFAGYKIFIDGFDSFSGNQLNFLEPVIRQCDEAHIALLSSVTNPCSCFVSCDKTAAKLKSFAEKEFKEIIYTQLENAPRYQSAALKSIRDNICADTLSEQVENDGSVKITEANDIYSEAMCIAAEISELVRSGMHYSDITVLCEDVGEFSYAFESACMKYDIPLFSDVPISVKNKPLMKYISALLSAAENMSVDNVMRYIKSGFVRVKSDNKKTRPITLRETNDFEQLISCWDLYNASWDRPFPKEKQENNVPYNTEKLENLRKEIASQLLSLKKACEKKDGAEITEALTDFLFDTADISAAIQGKCQDYTTRELLYNKQLTEEYNFLWEMFRGFLSSAHKTLGGMPLNLGSYNAIFRSVISSMNMSKPPQVLDSVLLGSPSRSRSTGAKAVFVANVNDGILPSFESNGNDIFTDKENEELLRFGIELTADVETSFSNIYLPLYRAFTLASEKLYVYYCSDGNKEKSEAINLLCRIINIKPEHSSNLDAEFYCKTILSSRSYLSHNITTSPDECASVEQALKENGDSQYLRRFYRSRNRFSDTSAIHTGQDAVKLLCSMDRLSPTAIKSLNSCRFDYFCNYGLNLRSLQSHTMNPQNFGTVIHFALQYCFEQLSGEAFESAGKKEIEETINRALDIFRSENLLSEEEASSRFNALYKKIRLIAVDLAYNMHREMIKSCFRPKYFELKLENSKTLEDGFRAEPFEFDVHVSDDKTIPVKIAGTVDRVDTAEYEGRKWIRVIDYKTGKTELDFKKVYYGLDLQLLLYLFTLCEKNKDYSPSSATYFYAKDIPLKNSSNTDEEILRGLWLEDHPESGIVLEGSPSDNEKALYTSKKISEKTGKVSDTSSFSSDIVSENTLAHIKDTALRAISQNTAAVCRSDVSAIPISKKNEFLSCTYCSMSAICGRKIKATRRLDDINAEMFNEMVKNNLFAAEKDGEN